MVARSTVRCFGCGGIVPDMEGPTHAYMLSAPGCWKIYGEILARDYGEYGYPAVHRITVDTYAVQHPGQPVRQAIQSVAVHLISLYYVFEKGYDSQKAARAMTRALQNKPAFVWLEPPARIGDITIADVARSSSLGEYGSTVRLWGESAWKAWIKYHDQIREWAAL